MKASLKLTMNTLTFQETELTTGQFALQEIERIKQRFADADQDWTARFAPSIVTRSEAEIFGLSSPRFAVRVYIDKSGRYFVNLRRLRTFCEGGLVFSERRPLPSDLRRDDLSYSRSMVLDPQKILLGQSCIADSFLPIPNDLHGFCIITADLAGAYGETSNDEHGYDGSVYVKHIALAGGGLCAQAVCFMAAAHLNVHASSIHGLAEITHYATNTAAGAPFHKLEIVLDGLDFAGMSHYFEAIGLRALLQKAFYSEPKNKGEPSFDLFAPVLKAYLLSKMPVIIPVDCERMAGGFRGYAPQGINLSEPSQFIPIYRKHNIKEFDRLVQSFPFNRHAILLVGTDPSPERDEFCFHDPLAMPFMTASAKDLLLAAAYTDNLILEKGSVKDGPGRPASVARLFLPITPHKVRMPVMRLVEETGAGQTVVKAQGVIDNALRVQGDFAPRLDCPTLREPPERAEQFRFLRLIKAGSITALVDSLFESPANYLADSLTKRGGLMRTIQGALSRFFGSLQNGENHWVWVQCLGDSVWIWDAEREPLSIHSWRTNDERRGFLRLATVYENGAWGAPKLFQGESRIEDLDAPQPCSEVNQRKTPGEEDTGMNRKPDASIITSISVHGLGAALSGWPNVSIEGAGEFFADLYAFMKADVDEYLRLDSDPANHWAVGLMSLLHEDDTRIKGIASKLSERFLSALPRRSIKVAALASFIPELASPFEDRANIGVQALIFLVKMARQLQLLGHPAKTLELVSGSLCSGIWPAEQNARAGDERYQATIESALHGRDPTTRTFAASLLSPEEGLNNLVRGLHTVVQAIINIGKRDGIQQWFSLSIEMEPGPLYVLGQDGFGSVERIRRFCQLLMQDKVLSPYVGLNLDIPHWAFLGGIQPSQLAEQDLFYRISHAHISDHGKGHFSDAVPGACHDDKAFTPWIELLGARIEKDEEAVKLGYPRFSRFVALELEAVKRREHVQAASEKLRSLLGLRQV
jgi:hypothetical protein